MFALWYLSFAVDEIRKRLCQSSFWSKRTTSSGPCSVKPETLPGGPPKKTDVQPAPATPATPTPAVQPVKPQPKVPLTPVAPIEIPKENPADVRLTQLESPETVELIKTFEIPDKINGSDEGGATKVESESPPIVPEQSHTPSPPPKLPSPEPISGGGEEESEELEPETKPVNPMESHLFGVPDGTKAPDMKDATQDFLSREHGGGGGVGGIRASEGGKSGKRSGKR